MKPDLIKLSKKYQFSIVHNFLVKTVQRLSLNFKLNCLNYATIQPQHRSPKQQFVKATTMSLTMFWTRWFSYFL